VAFNKLTEKEKEIIERKRTETPYTGKYDNFYKEGTYICKKCNSPLFSSKAKFDAGCGWPSFDENYKNSIKRHVNPLTGWAEITCAHCDAHLGHVFEGERLTKKNTRYCANSISMRFIPKGQKLPKVLNEK